ncbi:MAG: D-alanyl-D-alanine carboxypeptidase family protein [Candidatus Choladocola sp.]|nr:D-alanyl-D-alanine carboxypeptidase family protein [Candidatus Choladocola sp.]
MKRTVSWILTVGILLGNVLSVCAFRYGMTEDFSEGIIRAVEETESDTGNDLNLQTPHAAVMEVSTGKILYEKGADARVHPASVTKIMTILLIFEALEEGKLKLDQEVVTSAHAKSMGGSQVFLEEGEKQTAETLLKCIVIASGNDAAVAMAEQIGGTEESFVNSMNKKAESLGMNNTHFVDCCGLTDSADHYTSAHDVALMSRELLYRFPQVVEYSHIWMEDITHVTARGSSVFTLSNTNKLLRAYDGCDGLKTGSTSMAKYCLSATAMRDGIRLVSVVLTSPDTKTRFAEAGKLLNYGFSRCTLYEDDEMMELSPVEVKGAVEKKTDVQYDHGFSYLSTENEDFSQIERRIEWEEDIRAPLTQNARVGDCVYFLGDKEIGRVPIVTSEAVEKAGYLDYLAEMWDRWVL